MRPLGREVSENELYEILRLNPIQHGFTIYEDKKSPNYYSMAVFYSDSGKLRIRMDCPILYWRKELGGGL